MKMKYLYILPLLGAALMGCDKIEYSDAKPVTNPQLPGITMSDFSVTPSSTLTGLLDLTKLAAETMDPYTDMLNLYTVNVNTSDLPEGAVLSGGLELSATPDFANVLNIDDVTMTNGVAQAPLSSFLYVRSQMYGKDPRPYEIYYRVPVYVTVDGGRYKLGSKDDYFCDGYSFEETGEDPGYVVEEKYYLLGPAGNDLSSAVEFEHSGYNIYDDTIFTVTTTFAEGCSSWLVVPMSVYDAAMAGGDLDTSKCYGPDVATAMTGVLELGGEPGELTAEKKYQFSIVMSDLTFTITEVPLLSYGEPTGVYLRGDMNGWGASPDWEFIATDDPDVYILPYITFGPTSFKVADANWSVINLGGQGDPITVGKEYPLNGGDNINLGEAFTGAVILTNSGSSYSLMLQPFESATEGEGSGIYLRGGMNDWGAPAEYEFVTTSSKNVWTLSNVSISAGTEFKVADADWSSVNYGTSAGAGAFDETSGTGILGLVYNGNNINLVENFNGNMRLVSVDGHYYLYFLLNN